MIVKNKLTEEQVRIIKEFYKPYDKQFGAKPLAEKFGIHISTVNAVAMGRTYKEKEDFLAWYSKRS